MTDIEWLSISKNTQQKLSSVMKERNKEDEELKKIQGKVKKLKKFRKN